MFWSQNCLQLSPKSRGFHLVTDEICRQLPAIREVRVGLLHLFLQHTSASLSLNENADPDVPLDLEDAFANLAPEDGGYRHTCEGPDDMPAHVKSGLLGVSLTLPIGDGRLLLGTWQGVYLCEHRVRASRRRLIATISGELVSDGSGR
ncbi:MAG: secondary thiamine-phosphate synthase enzyme YjbQ [Planctomycetales bacterium]|nr:secondary thiamine-phosphate synthase enzyme YjbQ [Planctomycetales bacterium]